jgi:hypothetical protein
MIHVYGDDGADAKKDRVVAVAVIAGTPHIEKLPLSLTERAHSYRIMIWIASPKSSSRSVKTQHP